MTGESERDVKEGSGNHHPLHRSPTGEATRGLILPRALRDRRMALETEHLYPWELCQGYLEGQFLYWGP